MLNKICIIMINLFKNKPKELIYLIEKDNKKIKDLTIKDKIKLAKYRNTPINMLDELLLENNFSIRLEIYTRKDFNVIEIFLKNVNSVEHLLFSDMMTKIKTGYI